MRKTNGWAVSLIAAVLLAGSALAQPAGKAPAPAERKEGGQLSQADMDNTLYAVGATLGRSLRVFNLTPAEFEQVKKGLNDAATGQKLKVNVETYASKIQELARTRTQAKAAEEKKVSQAFLDRAAKEKGVKKMPSGLLFQELKPGTGNSPGPHDAVKVNFRGTLSDGTEFDSSVKKGGPATIPIDQANPCWTEGLQKMKVGGKAKLYCPPNLGYGDRGSPPLIPGGAALVYEMELVDVVRMQTATTPAPAPAWQPGQPKK